MTNQEFLLLLMPSAVATVMGIVILIGGVAKEKERFPKKDGEATAGGTRSGEVEPKLEGEPSDERRS